MSRKEEFIEVLCSFAPLWYVCFVLNVIIGVGLVLSYPFITSEATRAISILTALPLVVTTLALGIVLHTCRGR